MFPGQGLRSAWSIFSRPSPKVAQWPTFFKPNTRRTILNASRDNRWPTSPILPEGKGFNWDAFRWTNYRVIGIQYSLTFGTRLTEHSILCDHWRRCIFDWN